MEKRKNEKMKKIKYEKIENEKMESRGDTSCSSAAALRNRRTPQSYPQLRGYGIYMYACISFA